MTTCRPIFISGGYRHCSHHEINSLYFSVSHVNSQIFSLEGAESLEPNWMEAMAGFPPGLYTCIFSRSSICIVMLSAYSDLFLAYKFTLRYYSHHKLLFEIGLHFEQMKKFVKSTKFTIIHADVL